ncbi:M60 family metallopeptidase, partial [Arachidicoccus sp.]|uniref:M60 family metallopeptidase n=1 Tax=Arachidicoccus sp. TaxID=1872624 RepID=UPI003D207281
QWQTQLKNNRAPWGELASDRIIITLPDSVLQKVIRPDSVMKLWNLIIGAEMDLAQVDTPFYRPQRLVIDEHIGGGFMHSGYPIMVHHSPTKHMYSEDIVANPEKLLIPTKGGANWGFFHEIGHNMQNLDWVFDGTTEVSNNLFSLYCFDRLMGGQDDAHSGVSSKNTQTMMKKYFADGADYAKWKSDPFLGLVLFRQLQEGFGWESFKTFFRGYHDLAAKYPNHEYAKTDQQKRDLWIINFSKIVGRNLAPFFEKWGIPVSEDAKQRVSSLPIWMPYNFPPVD